MIMTLVRAITRAASWFYTTFSTQLVSAVSAIGRLGFGRQGGLVAARRLFPVRAHTPMRKAGSLLAGSLLIGVGVSLLRQADLGLTPYDVLVSGLQPRLGLSFGQTVWLISAVLFGAAALLREFPSRWGIAYVLAVGVAIDAVDGYINAPDSMLARILFAGLSLASLGAGISLVVHSGSTGGSFELLMRAGEKRGFDRKKVRTALEVSALGTGIALGGRIGPATVVIALSMGPILVYIGQALEDHSAGRILRQLENEPQRHHPSSAGARSR